ncbi:ATP-binding protein [Nonomuraea sp. NPDC050153]|uniref:ATP-binding protein n=1 Tax=Nonomuraea sp. NPDC050153 TaxID=3364359 RepID=UPI0037ADC8F1
MADGLRGVIPRRALELAEDSLASFRVVVLHGARQTGKTTLARQLAGRLGAAYVTLDRGEDRDAAERDPRTYLRESGTPLVIGEVQRVGEPLVLAIKEVVDTDNSPGRFLLTGSSNFLTVPSIAETLAGRVDLLTLWPLSVGELTGGSDDFVDRALGDPAALIHYDRPTLERQTYFEYLCAGGYPEVQRFAGRSRGRWFRQYVRTVLQREVQVAADIRRADELLNMVHLFAATTSQELVMSTVANRLGLDRVTASTYQPWLETTFLVHRLPAWSRNLSAKVVKRPKLYMADTGVAAGLLGKDATALRRPTDPAAGAMFETFVVNELAKQLTWSNTLARMFHFRESGGTEVDIVLEAADGRVLGIEVKASSTPREEDFRGLSYLRDRLDRCGDSFVGGIVLHTGERRLSFGDRLWALPASDVWG